MQANILGEHNQEELIEKEERHKSKTTGQKDLEPGWTEGLQTVSTPKGLGEVNL